MPTCPDCGRERVARFARCGYCGHRFVDVDPMSEISRTITFLTSDLQGSTALGERLDPETLRQVLDLYFDDMRLVIESRGGIIEKIIGDAILAVFGPIGAHSNHALQAIRAATESQAALQVLKARLDARWGVRLVNRTGIATEPHGRQGSQRRSVSPTRCAPA